jgi:putative transposase
MGRRGRSSLAEEGFFFVTATVVDHAKAFADERSCDILIGEMQKWRQHFGYVLLGYVIMPTHFHWIVGINPKRGTISDVMREVKSRTAVLVMDHIAAQGKRSLYTHFLNSAIGVPNQKRRFWTSRFDDQVILNQNMLLAKLNYVHNNPVVASLVARPEQYKYSSARNYILGDHSVLRVDVEFAG